MSDDDIARLAARNVALESVLKVLLFRVGGLTSVSEQEVNEQIENGHVSIDPQEGETDLWFVSIRQSDKTGS